ncbi:MAG: hypothetical protein HQM13_05375 [SAR324 cluster bacterium]|nr:hypothetical protein [SAR324 cluster bacterium]
MSNPFNAGKLLELYPNLMMNWKFVPYQTSLNWDNLERIHDRNGHLYKDWAVLFEAFPDRFMVGSDARFGIKRFSGKRYRRVLNKIRVLLGSIESTAAEMIGYKNAERIFGPL